MLVQPQQAATVGELDPVQHTIGSSKRAQTLDSNQSPENSHEPLSLTLDLEHAHVSGRLLQLRQSAGLTESLPRAEPCQWPSIRSTWSDASAHAVAMVTTMAR